MGFADVPIGFQECKVNSARFDIAANLVYDLPVPADILLAIEVAPQSDQLLLNDLTTIDGAGPLRNVSGEDGVGRRTWIPAANRLTIDYHATVEICRTQRPLAGLACTPRAEMDARLIPYLWPSRYCESDRFAAFVVREFGHLEGGDKVSAMAGWIRGNLDYRIGSSNTTTTAVDAFVAREGVCRDFAHLMAAFVRAADIPARLVSGYAFGLKSQDFHAIVEVWLDGAWHLVDATGLALPEHIIRIAVGRDATDVSFMTIFGTAFLVEQSVNVSRSA